MNQLEQLRQFSIVVADTGDAEQIQEFKPTDVTTNPSLILKAAQLPETQAIIRDCIMQAKADNESNWQDDAIDRLAVEFGVSLLQRVPGYVSTEVNARLSFDTQAMIDNAKRLLAYYVQRGVNTDRVLIKLAGTYEGIQAAKQLEAEGIKCNVTLVFHATQAIAAAQAGVFLISPFVGRIQDWYKQQGSLPTEPNLDPGVQSVKSIYAYFKKHKYSTIVMAASFRNANQITQLAGCDRLTISPSLLADLATSDEPIENTMLDNITQPIIDDSTGINEENFRWAVSNDPMTNEKLSEGIRLFYRDHQNLKTMLVNNIVAN